VAVFVGSAAAVARGACCANAETRLVVLPRSSRRPCCSAARGHGRRVTVVTEGLEARTESRSRRSSSRSNPSRRPASAAAIPPTIAFRLRKGAELTLSIVDRTATSFAPYRPARQRRGVDSILGRARRIRFVVPTASTCTRASPARRTIRMPNRVRVDTAPHS